MPRLFRRPALALTALALAAGALAGCNAASSQLGQELSFEDQGRQHLQPGDRKHPPFNSSPATSGWHWEMHAASHFLHGYLDPEIQVHELEHGAVIVQYNCDNCPDLLARLWRLQNERSNVIIAPNSKELKSRIVLTAWTKMLMLDDWDEAKAQAFIQKYGGRDLGDE